MITPVSKSSKFEVGVPKFDFNFGPKSSFKKNLEFWTRGSPKDVTVFTEMMLFYIVVTLWLNVSS
jgi:hypothetical protein